MDLCLSVISIMRLFSLKGVMDGEKCSGSFFEVCKCPQSIALILLTD